MPQKVEICLEKRNHPEHKYFVTLNRKIVFLTPKLTINILFEPKNNSCCSDFLKESNGILCSM